MLDRRGAVPSDRNARGQDAKPRVFGRRGYRPSLTEETSVFLPGERAVSRLPHVDSVRCAGRVLGAVAGVNADGEGTGWGRGAGCAAKWSGSCGDKSWWPRSVKRQRATSFGEARMGGGCVRVPLLEGRVEAQQPGLASSLVGLAGSLRRIAGTRGSETRRRGCRRVAKSRRRHRTMIDSVSIAVD